LIKPPKLNTAIGCLSLIKTFFLLKYIDDVELRQALKKTVDG
jgi:hypothetical protein